MSFGEQKVPSAIPIAGLPLTTLCPSLSHTQWTVSPALMVSTDGMNDSELLGLTCTVQVTGPDRSPPPPAMSPPAAAAMSPRARSIDPGVLSPHPAEPSASVSIHPASRSLMRVLLPVRYLERFKKTLTFI